MKKIILTSILLFFGIICGFFYYKFYYVFGEGVKSGNLNYAVYKGKIFKTYEGKIIQDGYGQGKTGQFQSYEFEFSIIDKKLYNKITPLTGQMVDLYYKEYNAKLPWRGNTVYIVDSIVIRK